MSRLTEDMVYLRTKTSDLKHVKKLNAWGSGVSDISVCERMPNVEVLALSVNNISRLSAVANLQKLETLYLRKNQISDVNEIKYLESLPALKFLWLDENPFCTQLGSSYRAVILSMLPHLQRLDDKEVSPAEVEEALRSMVINGDAHSNDEQYEQQQQQQQQQPPPQTPQRPQRYQQQHSIEERSESPQQDPQAQYQQTPRSYSPQESPYPPSPKYDSVPQQNRTPCPQQQQQQQHQQQYEQMAEPEIPPSGYHTSYRERPIPSSISTQSMKEYYHTDRPSYASQYAHSQMDLSDWNDSRRSAPIDTAKYRSNGGCLYENGACENHFKPQCPYHRRLINRTSNVLSATLCLIKELDLAALEVVEHTIRCRINELKSE